MTIGDLIKELQDYDPEMELRVEDTFGEKYTLGHLWQWDNSVEPCVLNTYVTLTLIPQ